MSTTTYLELYQRVEDTMARLYDNKSELASSGLTATVWEEGGEWYPYHPSYEKAAFGDPYRKLEDIEFHSPSDISKVATVVEQQFLGNADTFGVSLGCGAGKSTRLIAELFATKLSRHMVVLVPSLVTAESLAVYCQGKEWNAQYVEQYPENLQQRTCLYTSAACFLDALLKGSTINNTLVVLDEAHVVTPVYRALRALLDRVKCKVLLLTASTSSAIVGLKGSRLIQIGASEPTLPTASLSSDIAKYGSTAVTVGVLNGTYALPANLLIGATFNVKLVFDTGLRPDPVVEDGRVEIGERQATKSEIIQMVGRVGRTGVSGQAYYVDSAKYLRTGSTALYDVVFRSIMAYIDKNSSLTRLKAASVLRASGIFGPAKQATVASESSSMSTIDTGGFGSAHARTISATTISTDSSVSSFPSDSCRSSESDMPLRGPFPLSISSSLQTISSVGEGIGVVSKELAQSLRRAKQHGKELSRPFSRGNVEFTYDKFQQNGVAQLMYAMARVVDGGGSIYLDGPVNLVNSADIEPSELNEARLILAGRMLPSFSEAEMNAIMVCWDNMSKHTRSRVKQSYSEQFSRYFLDYAQYVAMNVDHVE